MAFFYSLTSCSWLLTAAAIEVARGRENQEHDYPFCHLLSSCLSSEPGRPRPVCGATSGETWEERQRRELGWKGKRKMDGWNETGQCQRWKRLHEFRWLSGRRWCWCWRWCWNIDEDAATIYQTNVKTSHSGRSRWVSKRNVDSSQCLQTSPRGATIDSRF